MNTATDELVPVKGTMKVTAAGERLGYTGPPEFQTAIFMPREAASRMGRNLPAHDEVMAAA